MAPDDLSNISGQLILSRDLLSICSYASSLVAESIIMSMF